MKSKPIYSSRIAAALTLKDLRRSYRQRDHKSFEWYATYIPGLYMADLISEVVMRRAYRMGVKMNAEKLRKEGA